MIKINYNKKGAISMMYFYPAIILDKNEQEVLSFPILFQNGYLVDNDLSIQKRLEDQYKVPIVSIQESTRDTIIILYDPNGFVDTNPLTKTRMAVLIGDFDYLQSEILYMVSQRPDIQPKILIDNYIFQCTPKDLLRLKTWIKSTFG